MTAPRQKTAAVIQDLSGFGKCSLTEVLPVLSAAGVACSAVPTAVLSSHTGGLPGVVKRDLTEEIGLFAAQWSQLGLSFDALYSGYLSSPGQVQACAGLVRTLRRPETLLLADPAIGDGGRLYQGISGETAATMREYCAMADVLTPNRTEAALLLGEPWREGPCSQRETEDLLRRLAGLGPRLVVLTGVSLGEGLLGAAGYDKEKDAVSYAMAPQVPGSYHGTGDLFSAALLAGLLLPMPLQAAMQAAADFVSRSIRRTYEAGTDPRFGVNFEQELPSFLRALGLL